MELPKHLVDGETRKMRNGYSTKLPRTCFLCRWMPPVLVGDLTSHHEESYHGWWMQAGLHKRLGPTVPSNWRNHIFGKADLRKEMNAGLPNALRVQELIDYFKEMRSSVINHIPELFCFQSCAQPLGCWYTDNNSKGAAGKFLALLNLSDANIEAQRTFCYSVSNGKR